MAPSPPVQPLELAAWRGRIPLLATTIPMNNCSQGPQTTATRAAAAAFMESWDRDGMDWDRWVAEVELARAEFASLINASADDVAVCSSVSQAASAVAGALDFGGARPEVVVTEEEFPTIGHVWLAQQRRGAQVRWVPARDGIIELDQYQDLVGDATRLVSACHGCYRSGFKQDVAAIARLAHDAGSLVFVDAYQTLGTCPVDVKAMDVDFLAGGTLKYLMGVAGIAFLYVRRELADSLTPSLTGWFGRREPFAFRVQALDWAPGARRFDTGTPPIINAYIARAGMQVIRDVTPQLVEHWTVELSRRLIEGGAARGLALYGTSDPRRKTPTTAFLCSTPAGADDAHAVEARMRDRGVLPSARGSVIRLAPHFYSSIEDVDGALDTLASVLAERR